jgi:hypothetical protein
MNNWIEDTYYAFGAMLEQTLCPAIPSESVRKQRRSGTGAREDHVPSLRKYRDR